MSPSQRFAERKRKAEEEEEAANRWLKRRGKPLPEEYKTQLPQLKYKEYRAMKKRNPKYTLENKFNFEAQARFDNNFIFALGSHIP